MQDQLTTFELNQNKNKSEQNQFFENNHPHKNQKEILSLQNSFLDIIRNDLDVLPSKETISKHLDFWSQLTQDTAHRIRAYQVSYYSRLSDVFKNIIYSNAQYLLPEGYLEAFVYDFYKNKNVTNDMVESSHDFYLFLKNHEVSQEYPFISEFILLNYDRYFLIHEKDFVYKKIQLTENTLPSQIYLKQPSCFHSFQTPIYDLWMLSEKIEEKFREKKLSSQEKRDLAQDIIDKERDKIKVESQNILSLKISPIEIEMLVIPDVYEPLVQELRAGKNLEEAIDLISNLSLEIDENDFSLFISKLTEKEFFYLYS